MFNFIAKSVASVAVMLLGLAVGVWTGDQVRGVSGAESGGAPGYWTPSETLPVSARFLDGEVLRYRLSANILGSGVEKDVDPVDITLSFESLLALETKDVDASGGADLEFRFEEVYMKGGFMGSPVVLQKDGSNTFYRMNREVLVDTAAGKAAKGLPQLEFLETPIQISVGADGDVREVKGMDGFEQILEPVQRMASGRVDPEKLVDAETQWTTDFVIPSPGIPTPPTARAVNTVLGFEIVKGRYCAVVEQQLTAEKKDGQLFSPEGVLGDAMGFSMPELMLEGVNMIYYDTENGQLVHTDMDLFFGLKIGKELQGATQLMGIYGSLLDELEGTGTAKLQLDTSSDLMELGVHIQAALALE